MNKLKELLSVLLLYRANFHNLHWNAEGKDFDTTHKKITSDYYEELLETADTVAEMICRFGENPPNYEEVLQIIRESERDYYIVESGKLFDRDDIVQCSQIMLNDVKAVIVETLQDELIQETENAGIKSTLESILDEYDLQARYINKRRA